MTSDHPPKKWLQWLRPRFSVRAFLLAITLASVAIGLHVHRARQQGEAVRAFAEYGGWVRYDYQFDAAGDYDPLGASWVPMAILERTGPDLFHSVVELNCVYSDDSGQREDNGNVEPAPLEYLARLPKLRGLYLHQQQANDDNLRHVARLKHLERFYVWDAYEVSDAGVKHLRNLPHLTYIHLSDSQITDASLHLFATMPQLEGLSLQFNRFSDAGVASLSNLKHLRTLWVCGNRDRPNDITDASLKFVFDLDEFGQLGVQNTQVTDEFEAKFTKRFPKSSVAR